MKWKSCIFWCAMLFQALLGRQKPNHRGSLCKTLPLVLEIFQYSSLFLFYVEGSSCGEKAHADLPSLWQQNVCWINFEVAFWRIWVCMYYMEPKCHSYSNRRQCCKVIKGISLFICLIYENNRAKLLLICCVVLTRHLFITLPEQSKVANLYEQHLKQQWSFQYYFNNRKK